MTLKPIDREALNEFYPLVRLLDENFEPLNEEQFRAGLVKDAAEARRMMEYCAQVFWSRTTPRTDEFREARDGLFHIRNYLRLFAMNLESALEGVDPQDD